jgi:hypothetical protein
MEGLQAHVAWTTEFVVRVPSVPHAAITLTRLETSPSARKGRRPQPPLSALGEQHPTLAPRRNGQVVPTIPSWEKGDSPARRPWALPRAPLALWGWKAGRDFPHAIAPPFHGPMISKGTGGGQGSAPYHLTPRCYRMRLAWARGREDAIQFVRRARRRLKQTLPQLSSTWITGFR